jgi:hypothetical protein
MKYAKRLKKKGAASVLLDANGKISKGPINFLERTYNMSQP